METFLHFFGNFRFSDDSGSWNEQSEYFLANSEYVKRNRTRKTNSEIRCTMLEDNDGMKNKKSSTGATEKLEHLTLFIPRAMGGASR